MEQPNHRHVQPEVPKKYNLEKVFLKIVQGDKNDNRK
jgi:hypothetical protein